MTKDAGKASAGKDGLDALDYYALLGIAATATPDEVRKAFHTFALRHHPDRHAGEPKETVERAAHIYRRGAEAYRVLGDRGSRARYDLQLQAGKKRFDPEDDPRPSRNTPAGGIGVKSPKARPFVSKAEQALKNGDLKTAKLNFQIALQHEPDNVLLREKLEDITAKLKG